MREMPIILAIVTSSVCLGQEQVDTSGFVFEPKRELVIQRDISGGAQHVYRVSLEKGQYIRLNVEQMGIELVVLVLDPNKRKIGEFASENAAAWGIIVQFVAELPGMYSLQIRPVAPTSTAGKYELMREQESRDQAVIHWLKKKQFRCTHSQSDKDT